jgi:hypothetical protein
VTAIARELADFIWAIDRRFATRRLRHEAARSLRRRLRARFASVFMPQILRSGGDEAAAGDPEDCKWPIIDRRPYEDRESPGRNLGNAVLFRA